MNSTAAAIITPAQPVKPVSSLLKSDSEAVDRAREEQLNGVWSSVIKSVSSGEGRTITVDVHEDEDMQQILTRLRMLVIFMNRSDGAVSATITPSFLKDTYPAMLSLVKNFEKSGIDWKPDGPRSVAVGQAKHRFVSVDMPVADKSSAPNSLVEVVNAHRVDAGWYEQRVRPRTSALGLTVVMFGTPDISDSDYSRSIYKRERALNLSGRPRGVHIDRHFDWSNTAVV